MCSAFTPDYGYDHSTINLIGNVFCPNTKCSGKICLRKKTFQSLGRSDYQCLQCAPVCQVHNIPFEDQTKCFFWSFGQGVYISEESPKSIQGVIGDVFCPAKYCFNWQKCQPLRGYVTNSRYIYGFGECGAWLFKKFSLRYKSTYRQQKRTKHAFFQVKKMNLLPDKQLFNNVPFQSTK